jgi:protein-S-isoprenylcysteine O-methyltransferase Ste14
MTTSDLVFIFLTLSFWVLITLYWILSARKVGTNHKGNEIFSFIKLIGSALIIYLPLLTGSFIATKLYITSFLTGLIGSVLCFMGVLIMVWAKEHLGKNWSGNVIIQQEHSLSRSGPYKYVRHPIYSGGLFAMFASAIIVGQIFGFIWVVFCIWGLNVKINKEEALLTKEFPNEYPIYKKQVKRLIPFIW